MFSFGCCLAWSRRACSHPNHFAKRDVEPAAFSHDPEHGVGRRLRREGAEAVGQEDEGIKLEDGGPGLLLNPVEDGFESGAAAAEKAVAVEAGFGALVELIDFLDFGIALDESEPALGDRAESIEFCQNFS